MRFRQVCRPYSLLEPIAITSSRPFLPALRTARVAAHLDRCATGLTLARVALHGCADAIGGQSPGR